VLSFVVPDQPNRVGVTRKNAPLVLKCHRLRFEELWKGVKGLGEVYIHRDAKGWDSSGEKSTLPPTTT